MPSFALPPAQRQCAPMNCLAQEAKEPTLFEHCRIIKLDEWGGLPPGNPATCDIQLRTTLVSPLNLAERYVAFESNPPDPDAECARVADWLDQNGPIDISVLGLGINGHLGFTEPAEYCNRLPTSRNSRRHRLPMPCLLRAILDQPTA